MSQKFPCLTDSCKLYFNIIICTLDLAFVFIKFCPLTGVEEHAFEEKWVKYENLVFKYGDIEHKRSTSAPTSSVRRK